MATLQTHTVTVTIDAPLVQVAADLADPTTHPAWATEFYAGPLRPTADGEFVAPVPMLGGEVRHRIDADIARGILDLHFAPREGRMAPPIPVRLVPNADGVDVLRNPCLTWSSYARGDSWRLRRRNVQLWQQNTATRRLTAEMLDAVFRRARVLLGRGEGD
jgi:hypothetical protein